MKKSIAERFWSKVDFSGECWEWKAFRNHDGYGLFFVNRNVSMSGMIVASRFAWELFNGPIPDGLCALHNCDNPPCVNPSHLFLGTREKNNEDMVLKDRQSKGEHRPQHKLTLDQVAEIKSSSLSCAKLANIYPVDYSVINRIRNGKAWRFA